MRVKATIAYDGSKFYGFQVQRKDKKNTLPTVISRLEALFKALHIDTKIEGSGRTDRGVHASGQVIAFDVPDYWSDLTKLKRTLNQKLDSIQFKKLEVASDDFHPRFDAKSRVYRYIVSTDAKSPFLNDYVTFIESVDVAKLKEAVKWFEGEHDFAMFRKMGSDEKSTTRMIFKAKFYRYRKFYVFYFEGNAFLRSQIRMMVESLLKLSNGRIKPFELKNQIENKARCTATLAPSVGLYLAKINYKIDK